MCHVCAQSREEGWDSEKTPRLQGREATVAAAAASAVRSERARRRRWRPRRGRPGPAAAEQERRRIQRRQQRRRGRAGSSSDRSRRRAAGHRGALEEGLLRLLLLRWRRRGEEGLVGARDLVHHAAELGGVGADVGRRQTPRRARPSPRDASCRRRPVLRLVRVRRDCRDGREVLVGRQVTALCREEVLPR